MIKDNQKVFNRLHVLMDVMITVASYALAYVIKIYIIDGRSPRWGYCPCGIILWCCCFWCRAM